jgi:hypothetical protein
MLRNIHTKCDLSRSHPMAVHGTASGSEIDKLQPFQRSPSGHMEHDLKSWPQFFELILAGEKLHELRRNDDRDFRVGDTLRLQEFDPKTNRYTGRELRAQVTYITSAKAPCALSEGSLHPNFCIISIKKL